MMMNRINEQYENGSFYSIAEIDQFSRDVTSSHEPGFMINRKENGAVILHTLYLGQFYPKIKYYLSQFDRQHVYAEYVQLFRDACSSVGLNPSTLNDDPYTFYPTSRRFGAEIYNALLEKMRSMSYTLEFRKRVYDREYNAVRNYQSCEAYVDALFDERCGYSRLLVLRLDFGYRKSECATIEQAQDDIERYLNNRRSNSLFDTRVGYIIALECTVDKGPHMHCFFFLDGSKSYEHVYLAQEYGRYWSKITAERGIFFNCNMKAGEYRNCGIGMIHYADTQMRENLLIPIRYITKSDQSVLVKASPKTRTFWRGQMPNERISRAGRPRTMAVCF
jgi:hypothetical protein